MSWTNSHESNVMENPGRAVQMGDVPPPSPQERTRSDHLEILRTNVDALGQKDQEFARSLLEQFERKQYLSEKQWPWIEKLADLSINPAPAAKTEEVGDFTGVVDLLETGHGNLKYPKIRLALADQSPVVLGIAGNGSKFPGTINVTDGKPFGENIWYGRVNTDGTYTTSRETTDEVIELLKALAEDPAEVAAAYGRLTGNCCFCHRPLVDDRSTETGYGPVCARNYDLPWGVRS